MCVSEIGREVCRRLLQKEHLLRKNLEESVFPLIGVVCCCSYLATKRKAGAK